MSISLEPLDRSSRNFVCRSTVLVARSSSGGVATRYVLPVLWMTSRLAVMGGMAKHGGCTTVKRLQRAALRYGGSLMSMNKSKSKSKSKSKPLFHSCGHEAK